jgi:hypothetical protein
MTAAAALAATLFRAMVAHTKPAHNDDTRPQKPRWLFLANAPHRYSPV